MMQGVDTERQLFNLEEKVLWNGAWLMCLSDRTSDDDGSRSVIDSLQEALVHCSLHLEELNGRRASQRHCRQSS